MENRNKGEGSFRGQGLNRHNPIGEFHRWPPGMSFTMSQPQTHMDDEFQQWQRMRSGGPFSEQPSRISGEFVQHYSQGSIATTSRAIPELPNSGQYPPIPISQSEDRTPTNVRGSNWSIAEDQMLCHAWVHVSTDPITGDSQKKTTFWRRVWDEFVRRHDDPAHVTRNQKACDQRFQLIRAECNKWCAAMKKIYDHPRSGTNALDAERATHDYYKGQNNGKMFRLQHCWEILRDCAKYTSPHGTARSSPIAPILLDQAEIQSDSAVNDAVNEESPTPTIGKRPPGRKASKEKASAKRLKSQDAESSIGDRIAKSIDEMNAASAAEIAKVHALNVEEQQMGMKLKRIQMNKERIQSIKEAVALERENLMFDALLYSQHPSLSGSPSDAMKRVAARQARIEQLNAQAQVFIAYNVELSPTTETARNLSLSFDDESNNPIEDGRGDAHYHPPQDINGLEMR